MSCALVGCNANVVILDRDVRLAEQVIHRIEMMEDITARAVVVYGDVLQRDTLLQAEETIRSEFGGIDALINGAGGNKPQATTGADRSLLRPARRRRCASSSTSTSWARSCPARSSARTMAEQKEGVILNISSMNAFRPLTRIPAYSAAKAGVSNFTQWLAVHMAQEYSPYIRVNAIAPGFFLTEQNRFLLTDRETGELTARGQSILDHTPMGRFGDPDDLLGTVLWLLSPTSAFVTGIVLPVDGGFSAFSGV